MCACSAQRCHNLIWRVLFKIQHSSKLSRVEKMTCLLSAGGVDGHVALFGALDGGVQGKIPRTLPQFGPLSPGSSGRKDRARIKVWLARLQLEAQSR